MRNTQTNLVNSFVADIMPYMESAKEYNRTHEKNYSRVYFAKNKDGKYGITLPGVFGIAHSANPCPKDYNTRDFATAWSMKVDDLLACGPYTYLEWCKKYNYLNRHNNDWFTGAEYIRLDTTKSSKEYALYIPQTGNGYERVNAYEDQPNFKSLKEAIYRRDQRLYTMVVTGRDAYEELTNDRIHKYQRILVKGYFQCIFVKYAYEDTDEARIDAYNRNRYVYGKAFNNAARFCEDTYLRTSLLFFKNLFENR